MQIQIYGKNIEVTPAMQNFIHKKLARLERFFHKPQKIHVELSVDKHHKSGEVQQVDMNIYLEHDQLRTTQKSNNMYNSISQACDELKDQALRDKEKYQGKRRKTIQIKRLMKSIWPWQKIGREGGDSTPPADDQT